MKITCDNCAAKYSIADEKVKGKVFKIRCKKCSQIIVVRGTSDEASADEAEPQSAAGGTDDAVWHVVIGRDQVGPMTGREVRDRFAAGELTLDSYVWREGFGDWQRLSDVADFADIAGAPGVGAGAPAAAAAPAPTDWKSAGAADPGWSGGAAGADDTQRADSASLFGGLDAPEPAGGADHGKAAGGDDLFGGRAGATASEPADGMFASSESSGGAGGGLFGDDGFGHQRDAMPKDPAVPVQSTQMTGQRGENSVLFSLANLQQLATGGKESAPSPKAKSRVASAGAQPTGAGGGSGLIDIRAMAASTAPADSGLDDDLPPAIGGFGGPIAAAPVLMPTESDDKPKWVLPALIASGVVVVAAVAVVIVVLSGKKPDAATNKVAANTTTPAVAENSAGGTTEKAGGTAAAGTKAVSPPAAPAKADTKTVDKANDKTSKVAGDSTKADDKSDQSGGDTKKVAQSGGGERRRGRKGRRGRRGRRHRASAPIATAQPRSARTSAPTARRTPRRRGGGRDELDDLLDGAMKKRRASGRVARPSRPAAQSSNLPERLSRSDIQGGMRSIKPRIKKCYDRFKVPGMAMVKVTIGGNGRVSGVRVSGVFGGTPTGSCVTSAVRAARFPKSQNSTTITYPFQLR